MKVWEMQIINLGLEMDHYTQLLSEGWEPFHFVLIPAPANPSALVTPDQNGGTSPTGLTMINVVGMRHQYDDGEEAPFERGGDRYADRLDGLSDEEIGIVGEKQ